MSTLTVDYHVIEKTASTANRLIDKFNGRKNDLEGIRNGMSNLSSPRNNISQANYFIQKKIDQYDDKITKITAFKDKIEEFSITVQEADERVANRILQDTNIFMKQNKIEIGALTALGVVLKEIIFSNPLSRFIGAAVDSTMEDFKQSIKDWYRNGGKEILINIGKVVAIVAIAVVCVVTLGAIGVALGATWLIYAGVGAGVAITGQLLIDLGTSAYRREFKLSSWQTYAGNGLGGAIGGALLPGLGGALSKALAGRTLGGTLLPKLGGFLSKTLPGSTSAGIGSFCSTGSGQLLEKFTGGENRSLPEIIKNTCFDGVLGFGLGFSPMFKNSRLNADSNSFKSVFKSGITKIESGSVRNMSFKVMFKGATSTLYEGLPGNAGTFGKQWLENKFSEESKTIKSDSSKLSSIIKSMDRKRSLILDGVN